MSRQDIVDDYDLDLVDIFDRNEGYDLHKCPICGRIWATRIGLAFCPCEEELELYEEF